MSCSGTHLERAILKSANLKRTVLTDAHLEGANLSGCDLEQCNLKEAILKRAVLTKANLNEANLNGCDLRQCNLIEVSMSPGTDLTDAKLDVYVPPKRRTIAHRGLARAVAGAVAGAVPQAARMGFARMLAGGGDGDDGNDDDDSGRSDAEDVGDEDPEDEEVMSNAVADVIEQVIRAGRIVSGLMEDVTEFVKEQVLLRASVQQQSVKGIYQGTDSPAPGSTSRSASIFCDELLKDFEGKPEKGAAGCDLSASLKDDKLPAAVNKTDKENPVPAVAAPRGLFGAVLSARVQKTLMYQRVEETIQKILENDKIYDREKGQGGHRCSREGNH